MDFESLQVWLFIFLINCLFSLVGEIFKKKRKVTNLVLAILIIVGMLFSTQFFNHASTEPKFNIEADKVEINN